MRTIRRGLLLLGGCLVLGIGVGLLLGAALGSDGFSTLVNGISLSTGVPFVWVNLAVSLVFIGVALARRLRPGVGTVTQVVVVGTTVSVVQSLLGTPDGLALRIALLVLAMPVLSIGIAAYLGSQLGAGPAEGAALAWDPPLPFRWSYSTLQLGGAVVGWLLGAAIGPGTVAVVVLLGPAVDVTARLLGLDTSQPHLAPG